MIFIISEQLFCKILRTASPFQTYITKTIEGIIVKTVIVEYPSLFFFQVLEVLLFNRFFHVIYKYFHSNVSGGTKLLELTVCLIWNLQLAITRCLWPNVNLKNKVECKFLSWVFQNCISKIFTKIIQMDSFRAPLSSKKIFPGHFLKILQRIHKEFIFYNFLHHSIALVICSYLYSAISISIFLPFTMVRATQKLFILLVTAWKIVAKRRDFFRKSGESRYYQKISYFKKMQQFTWRTVLSLKNVSINELPLTLIWVGGG